MRKEVRRDAQGQEAAQAEVLGGPGPATAGPEPCDVCGEPIRGGESAELVHNRHGAYVVRHLACERACPRCATLRARFDPSAVCNVHLPAEPEPDRHVVCRAEIASARREAETAASVSIERLLRAETAELEVARLAAELRGWRRLDARRLALEAHPRLVVDRVTPEAWAALERGSAGGTVLHTRPCPAWGCRLRRWARQVRAHGAPVPAWLAGLRRGLGRRVFPWGGPTVAEWLAGTAILFALLQVARWLGWV